MSDRHGALHLDATIVRRAKLLAAVKAAPGIYPTAAGWRVVACVGRGPDKRQEKAFPHAASLRDMTRWQETTKTALRATSARPRGSLLEDLELRYLPAIARMPTKHPRERYLRMWMADLGPGRARATVRAAEIRAILARWQQAHTWEAGTCNRVRTALMHFYTVLDGKGGANPVRDVPKLRERIKPPRRIDYATLDQILAAMPDLGRGEPGATRGTVSRTKARLRVLAFTGLPHAQIMAIEPTHIHWENRALYVPGRSKGAGTVDRWIPLSQAAMGALRAFADAGAFGPFSQGSMRKSFQLAARTIGRTDLTPYDLRHLFGTAVLACSQNRAVTRDLMLHTTDTTTARYVAGAIPIEQRAALDLFDAYVVAARCGQGADRASDSSDKPHVVSHLRP